jgi:cytochrome b pre-mRNA-processing protein 3
MIFSKLFRPSTTKLLADALYRCIVEQARRPEFYARLGVPDSVDGRFEMIVLHMALVIRRLGGDSETSQALFDLMFADMDLNLREMGVSDIGLARHVKRMAKGFLGRANAYGEGLALDDDQELMAALRRNLYGTCTEVAPELLSAMTAYVRRESASLLKQDTVESGEVSFGEPPL